jgi:hypothetical protein
LVFGRNLDIGLDVKQTLIGAIRDFVILDLFVVTKKINHIGYVKVKIILMIDSTVNIV